MDGQSCPRTKADRATGRSRTLSRIQPRGIRLAKCQSPAVFAKVAVVFAKGGRSRRSISYPVIQTCFRYGEGLQPVLAPLPIRVIMRPLDNRDGVPQVRAPN